MDQQYFNQPQYPQQQGQYSQQPASGYAGGGYQGNTSVMSVKDWIITYLLMCIPFANFVFLFMWAFGSSGNVNRKNWAKASLLWTAIMLIFMIVIWVLMIALGLGAAVIGGASSY